MQMFKEITAKATDVPVKRKWWKRREPGAVRPQRPRGKRKKWLLPVVAVLLLAGAAAFLLRSPGAEAPMVSQLDVTTLEYGEFINSISATGRVESASSFSVYSTLNYTVEAVYAEVGDTVTEGQVLAKLDEKSIRNQIASQESSMRDSSASAGQQIKSARDTYEAAKKELESGLKSSIMSAQTQLATAQENYQKAVDTYNRYQEGLNNRLNDTLLSQDTALRNAQNTLVSAQTALQEAQTSEDNAYEDWEKAQKTLADAEDDLNDAEREYRSARRERQDAETARNNLQSQLDSAAETDDTTQLQSQIEECAQKISKLEGEESTAKNQISTCENAVSSAETSLTSAKRSYDSAVVQVEKAERSLQEAKESLDAAQQQYQSSAVSVDQQLADYLTAVQSAQQSVQDAEKNLQSAQESVQTQLESYKNALSSAQAGASQNNSKESLRQLQVELESTSITAPCAGTVTAVYATVGGSGSGLLFVIEDVDHLVINSTVKEYDVGNVKPGMEVLIKSDASGSVSGKVSSIAPTSKKLSDGSTDTSGEAVFETEATVTEQDTGLRIGMSVQLQYIVERAEKAFSVPYDAIYQNAGGQSCILSLEEQENGEYLVREVQVETGIENDLNTVVSGKGLSEGMQVLKNASNYQHLAGQTVMLGVGDFSGGMQPGRMAG